MKNPITSTLRGFFKLVGTILRQPAGFALVIITAIGIYRDPVSFQNSLWSLPIGIANVVPWFIVAFTLVYTAVDTFCRVTLGRTLRSLVDDQSNPTEIQLTHKMILGILILSGLILLAAK